MSRTVSLRLLIMSTSLALLLGFALAYWRSQPPPYTPRAESLLYQTRVTQVVLTGPLRSTVTGPDGKPIERIMIPDEQRTAPGQSSFASVSGAPPTEPPAGAAPAAPTPAPVRVTIPASAPRRPPFPIDAAAYRATKDAVPEWLKEANVPVDLTLKQGAKQEGPAPLSLMFNIITETAPGAVGLKVVLDVKRQVVGNPVAREGERLTVRSYQTGVIWVAPAGAPAQLKASAAQLVKNFTDEWQVIQTTENESDEKE